MQEKGYVYIDREKNTLKLKDRSQFKQMDADGRIYWGKDGNNIPAPKRYLSEVKQGRVPQTIWEYSEVGHTQDAKKDLKRIR